MSETVAPTPAPFLPTAKLLVAALLSVALTAACDSAPRRPNVLLVTVDTLRADRLGTYGFAGARTPHLDAFAETATVFERAISASSRTAPSHASLFTSRWVRDHAIGYRNGSTRLRDEVTLAALLGEAGYETAAFVGNSMLHRRLGLDRGFALYDDRLPDAESNRPLMFERVAERTTLPAVEWLAAPRTQPYFLWVQYNDPHGPYTPPAGFAPAPETPSSPERSLPLLAEHHGRGGIPAYQAFEGERAPSRYRARYDGEIRYLDEWLGELLKAVEEYGGGRETVVVLTADHGESLGEEDVWFAHGIATTPNLVHVPLVLKAPGFEPGRVPFLVHHVDVLPTLLDLLGLPPLAGAAGTSLVPLLRGGEPLPERILFADTGNDVSAYRGDRFVRKSAVEGEGDASWRYSGNAWARDGSWAPDDVAPDLAEALRAYTVDRAEFAPAPPASRPTEERLRALGYLR